MTDEQAPLHRARLLQQPGCKDLTEQVNPVANLWSQTEGFGKTNTPKGKLGLLQVSASCRGLGKISSHEGAPCSDMLCNSKCCRSAYPKTGAQFPCAVHAFALGSSYLMRYQSEGSAAAYSLLRLQSPPPRCSKQEVMHEATSSPAWVAHIPEQLGSDR